MNQQINYHLQLHLKELKYLFFLFLTTYIYLFINCYYFSDQLIYLFIKSLLHLKMLKYLIYTDITEVFLTNFLISFLVSVLIFIPFFLLQCWYFFSPGLFKKENIKILKYLIFFLMFSSIIIFLILIKIIPNIWIFFLNENFSNNYLFNIYFEPKLNNYFSFLFSSFIYIYIIFLYPFFLFLLIFLNILKIETLIIFRQIFYLKFLILSAIISPPDIINQFLIGIPFIFFFEIYIFIYIYFKKLFFFFKKI